MRDLAVYTLDVLPLQQRGTAEAADIVVEAAELARLADLTVGRAVVVALERGATCCRMASSYRVRVPGPGRRRHAIRQEENCSVRGRRVRAHRQATGMRIAPFDESVPADAAHVRLLLKALAAAAPLNDDPRGDCAAALRDVTETLAAQSPTAHRWHLPAEPLALLLHFGDPVCAYDLDDEDPATRTHPAVVAASRLRAALDRHAPRTTAALKTLMAAEYVIYRIENHLDQ